MDDLAHRLACASLARRIFRTNCMGYGYACPRPGDDVWKWPADINESIPALQANVPALRSCPEAYIREDSKLPIARAVPVLPSDVVDDKITGWVALRLDIDEFGKVANARVALSTSSRLEEPALEAVRRFRYQPELRNGRYVTLEDVSAVVYFHYWLLAEATGCSISYE